MQAVRETRSMRYPVWCHYMLFKPGPGVWLPHWEHTNWNHFQIYQELQCRHADESLLLVSLHIILQSLGFSLSCHFAGTASHLPMSPGLSCCCYPGLPVVFCPTGSQSLPCWLPAGCHLPRSPPQTIPKIQRRLVYLCLNGHSFFNHPGMSACLTAHSSGLQGMCCLWFSGNFLT